VGIFIALAIWQFVTVAKIVNPVAIPSMTSSFSTLGRNLSGSVLWVAVGDTLKGMLIGLAIGVVAGVLVGTAIGLSDTVYKSCFLVVEFGRVMPVVALVPLAVLFFGSTLKMALLIVTYAVFFPMVIQTVYGVRAVEPVVRDTAKMFNFRRREKFFSVILPSAAPYLATGLRIATSVALLVDVLAELAGGGGGLGTGILEGESSGVVSYTYALIIVTGIIGLTFYLLVSTLERRVLRWHVMYRREETA
jgi:ABC-type nitrate/sulfonate/bicarbonate transport system permease component